MWQSRARRAASGAALWRFAREGASIALMDVDTAAMGSVQTELIEAGTRTTAITTDITNALNCQTAIDHVVSEFGGIDVLINNAGITHFSLCERTDSVVYRRVMEGNLFGAVHFPLAALPSLIERPGAFGVLSSIAGFAPLVDAPATARANMHCMGISRRFGARSNGMA